MPVASVNGVDLYYETSGTGFPLVLAHGYCTSINLWQHQMPLLAQRYRVIAYDARGHGLSSAPAGKEHYTLEHLVAGHENFAEPARALIADWVTPTRAATVSVTSSRE